MPKTATPKPDIATPPPGLDIIEPSQIKFSCAIAELQSAVAIVSRAIAARPSHPVLACILLDAGHQGVKLTAFDLALGISILVPATVEMSGKFALSGRLLTDILNRQPDGTLTVSVAITNESNRVKLAFANGKYDLRGLAPEEFPALPEVEQAPFAIAASALTTVTRRTLYAASADESKQILTGLRFTLTPDSLECAATDGHRLATAVAPFEEPAPLEPIELTIPAKAIAELSRLIERQKVAAVTVAADGSQLRIESGTWTLTSRLLEGAYPNYKQLIPQKFGYTLTANRKELIAALERIAIMADAAHHIVKFAINGLLQTCEVSANTPDLGSALETLNIQTNNGDFAIAFCVKYVLDALKNFSSDDVEVQMNSATSPAVFRPIGGDNHLCLVMPVQVRF